MMNMRQEVSAGGVVRNEEGRYLVGKHSGYHKWALPKGMVEEGETNEQAALREVWEETGVRAKISLDEPLKIVEYEYSAQLENVAGGNPHTGETTRRVVKYQEEGGEGVRVHKRVYFYLMEKVAEEGEHGWEMEEVKWVSYEEAMSLLAFADERGALEIAREYH